MMTLDALPVTKRQRFAKETLEIFAPLANRLGISNWKEQLENLCFKHLNPSQHEELSSKLVESYDDAMITSAIERLEQALKDEGISYYVISGRHKSLYSVYCKMLKYASPSLTFYIVSECFNFCFFSLNENIVLEVCISFTWLDCLYTSMSHISLFVCIGRNLP